MALTLPREPVLLADYAGNDALAALVCEREVSPHELLDAARKAREAGHALPLLVNVKEAA
jgi:hypothetical protein